VKFAPIAGGLPRDAVFPIKACYTCDEWVTELFRVSRGPARGLHRYDPDILRWLSALWERYQEECSLASKRCVRYGYIRRRRVYHRKRLWFLSRFLTRPSVRSSKQYCW